MKSTVKVTATSAIELTKAQVKKIVAAVEKKYKNSTVELEQVIDPSMIAGIKLKVGSEEIDATVYHKLEQLHAELKQNL